MVVRSVVARARAERLLLQPGVAALMEAAESLSAAVMEVSCSPTEVMAAVLSRRDEVGERGARVASGVGRKYRFILYGLGWGDGRAH